MIPGAYSNRFRQYENEHVQHVKQTYEEERADMQARNRHLQQETSRRRRNLAIKRKLEAQKEEKRRQEILSKRREQQREATERFQRLNGGYRDTDPYIASSHINEQVPALEDALRAVRGSPMPHQPVSRQGSASSMRSQAGSATYRKSSAASERGQTDVNEHVYSKGDAYPEAMNHPHPGNKNPSSQTQSERTREHAREIAARAELQSRSLHNLTNSRSLFEKQLEQQQRLLVDHQRESLHLFNAAIRQEIEHDKTLQGEMDGDYETRSDSPCSVDSLEESRPASPLSRSDSQLLRSSTNGQVTQTQSNKGITPDASSIASVVPMTGSSTMTSTGFILHRNYGTPSNVAIVTPTNVTPPSPITDVGSSMYSAQQPDQPTAAVYKSALQGDMKLEDATEIVTDALDRNPQTLSLPGKSDPYYTATPGNGRKSGQHPQDTVVYTTLDPTQAQNYLNNQYSKLSHNTPYPGGYIDSFASEMQPQSNHTFRGSQKAWKTGAPDVNRVSSQPGGTFYMHPHPPNVTTGYGSTYGSNYNPYTSHLASANSNLNGVSIANTNVVASTSIAKQANAYPSLNGYNFQVAPGSFAAVGTVQSSSQARIGLANSILQNRVEQVQKFDKKDGSEENEDTSTEEDAGDEPDENSEPVPEKTLKGILKKKPSAFARTSTVRGSGYAARHAAGPPKRSVSVNSNHSVRDSLEVAKSNINTRREEVKKVPKKKSVHFADVIATSQYFDGLKPAEEKLLRKKSNEEDSTRTPKPPRPESAKVTSNTPKVDQSVKQGRVASAPVRRGTFIRPSLRAAAASATAYRQQDLINANTGNPKVPLKSAASNGSGNPFSRIPVPKPSPSSNSSPSSHTGHRPAATAITNFGPNGNPLIQNGNGDSTRKSVEALYDANGLRLDRTPTDEEINWLWDKVRTCLQRESSVVSESHGKLETPDLPVSNAQHSLQMSQKTIQFDGNGTTNALRASTHLKANDTTGAGTSTNVNPTPAPPKKVTMNNLNSYARRQGLLQRPQSGRKSLTGSRTAGYPATTTSTIQAPGVQQPLASTYGPASTFTNGVAQQDVSESMAAFLTAEMLARRSMSDSQIEQAMDKAQSRQYSVNAAKPTGKVSSALSIEEQRLMQSLERLNERLKLTEAAVAQPHNSQHGAYVPKPPAQRSGFRGHQPLNTHQRRFSANSSTAASRHQLRTGSAGMYRTQPRYH